MNRRGFLRAAAVTAPAVILTPGLLMPVKALWTPRDPLAGIVFPLGDTGVYCGRLMYFPRRLSNAELAIATRNDGTLTVQLSATGCFDFTDREWQLRTFS